MSTEEKEPKPKSKPQVAEQPLKASDKLKDFIDRKCSEGGKVAVFTHATPDPDAIGSQIAISHLLKTFYKMDVDCFIDGSVSHPQNKVAVQLLDPNLIPVAEYDAKKYCLNVLVDTVPSYAGVGNHKVDFDIVVDHHKEVPNNFNGLVIHSYSGSCCGIVHELLVDYNIEWDDDNEEHVKIASAIWAGVITDTDFCTKPDTTYRDFRAQQNMFQHADDACVRKIVRFNWPMSWVKLLGIAINQHEVHDGLAIIGLGQLATDQYDAVASIADQMLTWGNIHTAVVFALFDGEYISGCLRTIADTIEAHSICAELGGEHGHGGGKDFAGRYSKPLGAFAFDLDDDNEVSNKWWELQKEREVKKILRVLSKYLNK